MTSSNNSLSRGLQELGLVAAPALEAEPIDPLRILVAEVISEILSTGNVVAPIDVLVRLEILTAKQCSEWRSGALPYLERGITAGLGKVAKLLRLVDEEARALGLTPTPGKYARSGKGPKRKLRFSKRGDAASEAAYARHYVRNTHRP